MLGTDLWGIKPGHDNGRIAINLRALAAFLRIASLVSGPRTARMSAFVVSGDISLFINFGIDRLSGKTLKVSPLKLSWHRVPVPQTTQLDHKAL